MPPASAGQVQVPGSLVDMPGSMDMARDMIVDLPGSRVDERVSRRSSFEELRYSWRRRASRGGWMEMWIEMWMGGDKSEKFGRLCLFPYPATTLCEPYSTTSAVSVPTGTSLIRQRLRMVRMLYSSMDTCTNYRCDERTLGNPLTHLNNLLTYLTY